MNQSIPNNCYVISDLHLAEGNQRSGIYLGTENFFADIPFEGFINHITENSSGDSLLIINGDFVDFIRITHFPKNTEINSWKEELDKVKAGYSHDALKTSISKKEEEYGLKSNDYKCIWKLFSASNGHKLVFKSLSKWLDHGNRFMIIKGNHDVEWHWPLLQDYLKTLLFELSENKLEREVFYSNIDFTDEFQMNGIHIEHGHNFDSMTMVDGPPTLASENRPDELRIPMGSFFNRYLINKVEMYYPYIDNFKGAEKFVKILFKERLALALKLVLHYGSYLIYILFKFKKKSLIAFAIQFLEKGIPAAILAFALYKFTQSHDIFNRWLALASLGPISINMLFKFLFSLFGAKDKSLKESGIEYAKGLKGIDTILLGHNHNPEYCIENGIHYINSGAWVLTLETNHAVIRNIAQYTVIKAFLGDKEPHCELLNWNINSQNLEPFPTIKKF